MNSKKKKEKSELQVGVFITFGLSLLLVAIMVLGGSENAFTSKANYKVRFQSGAGLMNGAKVMLSGIPIGNISDIDYESETQGVEVTFRIEKKFSVHLREGTTVEVLTQGVLGDKYLSIHAGSGEAILPEEATIPQVETQELGQLISKSDQLLVSLTSASKSLERVLQALDRGNRIEVISQNLATTTQNLNKMLTEGEITQFKQSSRDLSKILEKINNGTGTIGALINDPELYQDIRALVGGVNRNRILRNLVRKTAQEGVEK